MESDKNVLESVTYLAGSADVIKDMAGMPVKEPFSDDICSFLSDMSKVLMADKRCREYPDVITFAFWIRGASVSSMKEHYKRKDGNIRFGRGTAFHIAPSNVAVNFAYSLAAGLLAGNCNIVRIPGRDFPQTEIIADALNCVLKKHKGLKNYAVLVRYGHDQAVNDALSGIADIRIVWGGDATIAELRKSPLPPRSIEITFADRYSLAVIESDAYLAVNDKKRVAEDFYNDTYLNDQNACTSPRFVIWTGSRRKEAKKVFWDTLHGVVKQRYTFQDIQGVNKLASTYLAAAAKDGVKVLPHEDNLIIRVKVEQADRKWMDLKDHSGYFFEYDCDDVMELRSLCNDKRCQTIAVLGAREWLMPLIKSGLKGTDRITDIGHTMDFELIWDGYELIQLLTRSIAVRC